MTCKLNADTSDGLKIVSDTSGAIDLQSAGTTKMTVGTTIDIQGNELVLDADADTSIHASTDDQIDFKTGGTDRVHITSDGKVGIGTSSPTDNLTVSTSGSTNIMIKSGNSGNGRIHFADVDDTDKGRIIYNHADDGMQFWTNDTQAHKIDSFRQFLFGGITSELTGNGGCLQLKSRTGSEHCATFRNGHSNGGFGINFQNTSGTQVGSIAWTASATNFNTSSDYRLKENINYTFDATTEVKNLKPCKFNFKDESDTVEGFLAHEVSDVVPTAVSGTKDETRDLGTVKDADGNVIRENVEESLKEDGQTWEKTSTENLYQSIDQSKLVPLLVKTIQELEARITALES